MIFGMIKKYIMYALLVMIPISLVGGVYVGVQYQKGRELTALQKQLKREMNKVKSLENTKLDSEKKLRAASRKDRKVQGACLDPDLPDDSLIGLWLDSR